MLSGSSLIYFVDRIRKIKEPEALEEERQRYIKKRSEGDHTYETLAKIQILTTKLLEKELKC